MQALQFSGSFGLVIYQRRVALLHRDNIPTISSPNLWCFIGGMADEGESPLQTFLREAQEEINAVSENILELPQFVHDNSLHGVYVMDLNEEEYKRLRLGDEGQKFDFFNLSQVLELNLTQTTRAFVDQERDRIHHYVD